MKRILLVMSLMLMTALSSFAVSIGVLPSSLSYASPGVAGQIISITVPVGMPWTITVKPSWVTLSGVPSGTGSGSVTVSAVTVNPSLTSSRSGVITVSFNGGASSTDITVTQTASPATMSLVEYTKSISSIQNTYTEAVTSDADWNATATSTGGWLRFGIAGGTYTLSGLSGTTSITFYVDNNTTGAPRTGTISISAGVTTITLTVTQQDVAVTPYLTTTVTALTFASNARDTINGSTYINKIQVSSNTNWSMAITDASWLNIENGSGTILAGTAFSNDTILWIRTLNDNTTNTDRTTTITLSSPGLTNITINITQKAQPIVATLVVSTNSVAFTYNQTSIVANTQSVQVTSNDNWTITGINISWLDFSSLSSFTLNGNQLLSIVPGSLNNTAYDRTATITLTSGSVTAQYTITQTAESVTTGINDGLSTQEDFVIYPNPSSGSFNVSTTNVQSISVFNEKGTAISSQNTSEDQHFDLSTGIYFVQVIKQNGRRAVKKLVIL